LTTLFDPKLYSSRYIFEDTSTHRTSAWEERRLDGRSNQVLYQKKEEVPTRAASTECELDKAKRKNESRAKRQTGIITLMESCSSRYVAYN
jgi:hypothetical protein